MPCGEPVLPASPPRAFTNKEARASHSHGRRAQAARAGADATAAMGRAKAGRASYVPEENLLGHNDPGAEAVARLFEGLAKAM